MKSKLYFLGTLIVLALGFFGQSTMTSAADTENIGRATFGVH